jgi:hypothetical protein
MTLCLQYQTPNADILARIVVSTLERASQPAQDNDRTDCIESTQCYVPRPAVNCRSATVSLSIHNNIKSITTMLTRYRLIERDIH